VRYFWAWSRPGAVLQLLRCCLRRVSTKQTRADSGESRANPICAVEDARFTTLATVLEAANLVDTLKSQEPFTIFAPTEEAFGRLPEGTVEGLLEDTPALTDVLLYQVVSGDVRAADLAEMETVDTLLEEPLTISIENGEVRINDSQVVTADIEASN
jgi:uncharacterized surface protein with fasciclin (FAS1) repeats